MVTIEKVEEILSVLTEEQKQLLKDTINYGSWGDSTYDFIDGNGKLEEDEMFAYCTNDAKKSGQFLG